MQYNHILSIRNTDLALPFVKVKTLSSLSDFFLILKKEKGYLSTSAITAPLPKHTSVLTAVIHCQTTTIIILPDRQQLN